MQYNLSKIIIAIIVVVVILGGVGAWYLLQPQSSTQTGIQATYGGGNTSTQTNITTTNSQTISQTQAPLDIEKAYSTLFTQISAQRVNFVSVGASTTGSAASIYALYSKDVTVSKSLSPSTTDFSIQVAAVDLNNDGSAEAVVYENLPGFCGSGGCSVDIYQVKQSKWVKISTLLAGPDIGLSNKSTNGYLDFFLSVPGDVGSQSQVVHYVWDGTQYQPQETVAMWDGTQFNLSK